MALVEIHTRLANTIVLFCVIMAIWGALRFLRKKGLSGSFWGAMVIAEVLILLQGALGIYLWIMELRPGRGGIHPLSQHLPSFLFMYLLKVGKIARKC